MKMSAQVNVAKVAAASAALLVAAPAFAGDAEAGEKIFTANCAACHAGGQNSVVPDHTLEKAAIEKVRPSVIPTALTRSAFCCGISLLFVAGFWILRKAQRPPFPRSSSIFGGDTPAPPRLASDCFPSCCR